MHTLVTDSGVGGLSVVAYAERFVREHGTSEPVKLTFANAAPENHYGYNSMPTQEEKLATFDRFLRNVTRRFSPDSIYVACNTLSVLMGDTPYVQDGPVPVKGIVETGVTLVRRELEEDPERIALVFGTQTTIDAGAYPRMLVDGGIDSSRIVSQACPGLADTISEDRDGTRARREITSWAGSALSKARSGAPLVAALACTHYGYRKDDFRAALEAGGRRAVVIDPNESAVDEILPGKAGPHRDVEVDFVTRYAIPDATVETLTRLLGGIAPRTVAAMRNFRHLPDLF